MTKQYLRRGRMTDLPAIMAIYTAAKEYLAAQNIDQWQDGYPDEQALIDDIEAGENYVLVIDGVVAASGTILTSVEEAYTNIEDGAWLNGKNDGYASFHRTAISNDFRGQHLAQTLMQGLTTIAREHGFTDLRVDTHPDNKIMQHVITKAGFDYVGVVWLIESGIRTKRLAYEMLVD
ncbi:GNAT family N-acetyltransferase [Periweissella cryptocerci]|uniref:GNAT family N-acetyltransferase n=1 Tax=Periweissella cryptocerci TaxID=2506420 RepID=A0A4P6YWV2_9LACO|nr:GNAT family N-acetyltransferase [Periweissella cryptocerci]QBO37330.1 GNAT family N-acetyltransferase [Periweissella cryptocerci]